MVVLIWQPNNTNRLIIKLNCQKIGIFILINIWINLLSYHQIIYVESTTHITQRYTCSKHIKQEYNKLLLLVPINGWALFLLWLLKFIATTWMELLRLHILYYSLIIWPIKLVQSIGSLKCPICVRWIKRSIFFWLNPKKPSKKYNNLRFGKKMLIGSCTDYFKEKPCKATKIIFFIWIFELSKKS